MPSLHRAAPAGCGHIAALPRPPRDAMPNRRLVRLGAWAAILCLVRVASVLAQPVPPPDSLAPPGTPHTLGVRDLWALERVSEPQPSPDGRWVVYVRARYDPHADRSRSNLWLVPAAGGEARRLTTAEARDTNPRWSPDGSRIAFLSDRGGSPQIWSIDLQGGEAHLLLDIPAAVESFKWSPAGTAIAFVAEIHPDCATLECSAERAKKLAKQGTAARGYSHLLFRHWDAWDNGLRRHLFVIPAVGGVPVDILKGADLDAPPRPSGGLEAYDWSPDGREVVFQGRLRTLQASWTTNLDLFVGSSDGSGYRCITESNLAADAEPVYASDGRSIAYLAMSRPGYEADRQRILLYERAAATRRSLTDAWDRSPAELVWSPSGKRLYVAASDEGRRQLFAVGLAPGEVRKIPVPGSVSALGLASPRGAGERLVFLRESLTEPAEVYSCAPDGSELVRLTNTNAPALALARMSQPQEIWAEGASGARLHAWLHPPVDRQEGKRYPLLLLVHGGPQGSWEDRFSYRWNPQVFAGAGYAVLTPDPHGSTGYGQAFTDAIRQDWGGKSYEDLMKAVDHVLATVPYADRERLAAAGGSYGGYMINWIAGHTDRFRCLVNHDGIFDLRSFYGSTEEQWFPEWEFGGTPWESPEQYQRWSPSTCVRNWKTPMLVIQGGKDYRVHDGEAFATFTTLQRLGIPSELLYFPEENHLVLKARDSILWHDRVLGWLGRWLEEPGRRGGAND